jgi:hypothetical protein
MIANIGTDKIAPGMTSPFASRQAIERVVAHLGRSRSASARSADG